MRYLFLLFSVISFADLYAQHCPYDGATLVAVKFVGINGLPVDPAKDTVYLAEVENPEAALCSYAAGLLKIPLLNTEAYFAGRKEKYGAGYNENLKTRLKNLGVTEKANLFVSLNQAERTCMIKKDGDFEYRQRKFVITYSAGKKKISIPVPDDAIRSLCTSSKDFINFKPLLIKL